MKQAVISREKAGSDSETNSHECSRAAKHSTQNQEKKKIGGTTKDQQHLQTRRHGTHNGVYFHISEMFLFLKLIRNVSRAIQNF